MSEDAAREAAAGNETRGVASPEFFFLLQRIDRLDEKLSARMEQTNARIDQLEAKIGARIDQTSARIDQLEAKLGTRIDHTNARIDQLEAKLGAKVEQVEKSLRQEISAFKGTVWTAAGAIIAAFGVVVAVLLALRR